MVVSFPSAAGLNVFFSAFSAPLREQIFARRGEESAEFGSLLCAFVALCEAIFLTQRRKATKSLASATA